MSEIKVPLYPKLVASDIGGTLAHGNNPIPFFSASVLDRLVEQKIPTALITGYNYTSALHYTQFIKPGILLLPQNGTLCIKDRSTIWEYRIPAPGARELCHYLQKNKFPIVVYKGENAHFVNYYIFDTGLPLSDAFRRVEALDDFEDITGISTLLPDDTARAVRKDIEAVVGNRFKVIYTREKKGSWLEVVHVDVRKDLAIKRLCDEFSISLEEVVYFGDNMNDLEALRIVGHPVIVGNAQEELKQEFSRVVRPVHEEGAAHYLNELFGF